MDIICFSTDHWDSPMWTNKQHIMSRLADRGHRVLFVDPVIGLSAVFSQKKMKTFSLTTEVKNNLWVHPFIGFPFSRILFVDIVINVYIRRYFLKMILKTLKFNNPLLWIYHPDSVVFIGSLNEMKIVYHCVDEISAWSNNEEKNCSIKGKENTLLKHADYVFTASKPLYEARKHLNHNTYLMENVADYEHFSKAQLPGIIPDAIKELKKPIIGFIGAIRGNTVDVQLLLTIAKENPGFNIVLIGPVFGEQTKKELTGSPNIYLLGIKEYAELPDYLRAIDVCIVPYLINNEYINNVFPMKIYEYLAAGKPVVATPMPSLEDHKDSVKIACNATEFKHKINEALTENTNEMIKRRMAVAAQNTWDKRIDNMLEIINSNKKYTENT